LDIPNATSMDKNQLAQSIMQKQGQVLEKHEPPIIIPTIDPKVLLKPKGKEVDEELLMEVMQIFIDRGLTFRIDGERWYMQRGLKTDEGPLRMPLRSIAQCAEKMFANVQRV